MEYNRLQFEPPVGLKEAIISCLVPHWWRVNANSAQRLEASKCTHDHVPGISLSPALLHVVSFEPRRIFNSATSALKMPVKFLTKGALYVIFLPFRCWDSEKVGVRSVTSATCDARLSLLLFAMQWWMRRRRANNVFKPVRCVCIYRLSSTSCIYWLGCSFLSSSGSLVKQEANHSPYH